MQHAIRRQKSISDFWFESLKTGNLIQVENSSSLNWTEHTALIFMKSSNSKMDHFLLLLLWTNRGLLPLPICILIFWQDSIYEAAHIERNLSTDLLALHPSHGTCCEIDVSSTWFHWSDLFCSFVFFSLCVYIGVSGHGFICC